MILLTKYDGTPLYINPSAVSAVSIKDGDANVYVVGDSLPFVVKEPIESVIKALSEILY